ncbi:hypothetical protein FA95DRAFT_971655 [Auriscalpium vulgare]|uniref:Uncharacterized protein n=1 Tax=Auriscalpium vulgare TaxID=40419 RepID=A0ACB8RYP7_9AGAM|nr:hypothetical protein FA95DRAFT_971655 [Auriscalpium vulgare]
MPSTRREPPPPPGILSSVLGFLSREATDFVSSVVGGAPAQIPQNARAPTARRSKSLREGSRRARKERVRRAVSSDEDEEEDEEERRERRRPSRPRQKKPSPPRQIYPQLPQERPTSPEGSPSPSHRGQSRGARAALPRKEDALASNSTLNRADRRATPSPSPPPPPRALKRRPSITMPGSLFPRSPSLDPDDHDESRRVRFASLHPSPASEAEASPDPARRYVEYEVPLAGPSNTPERPQQAHASATPARPRSNSGSGTAPASDAVLPSPQSSPSRRFSPAAHGYSELSMSEKARGKQRAVERPLQADTSGEIRVLGKEQELVAIREEQMERAQHWEDDADKTWVQEERDEYEARIKSLEHEVRRLRDELSKRPTPSTQSAWLHMPPPPPPPPPLPTATTRVPTASETGALFTNMRASLKPMPHPQEAPISAPARAPKRTGQPAINVPSDKMAAFLTEMKTVRLRKVAHAPPDFKRPEPPRPPPRPEIVDLSALVDLREKRKRVDSVGNASLDAIPNQRRRLTAFGPPRRASVSNPTALRAWPSSSVDGTTPSLASDNDDTSPDDRVLPPTPPTVPVSDTHGPAIVVQSEAGHSVIAADDDVHMASPQKKQAAPRDRTPVMPEQPQRMPALSPGVMPTLSPGVLFDRRAPTSPMPSTTPRRPPRPGRKTPSRALLPVDIANDEDDELLLLSERDRSESPSPPQVVRTRPPPSRIPTRAVASRVERRHTLDEELRHAIEGLSEEDLRALEPDLEEQVYQAPATPGRRKSFLARGGAGGPPVRMGVGYVPGADADEDGGVEERAPRKAKGRGRRS